MEWHQWLIECTNCRNQVNLTEVFVNANGELLLEGYCEICEADVVGEPTHVFSIMEKCQQSDEKRGKNV